MISPLRKWRLTMAPRLSSRKVPETPLKTGISGILVTCARGRMIGHDEFEKRLASAQNCFRIGDYFHAGFDRTDARGSEDARAGVHHAEATNADGSLILQMAERGDVDAVH